jgi:two-component system, response regulator YesN
MYQVLVVDDERIERNGIKMLLRHMQLSCEIAEAANGREALDYLKDHKIDILLTDVKMPFMDGIRLIEECQKIDGHEDMKCVIFSGCSEFDYARKAVRLGVSDYILKPVDPNEFKETISRAVQELEAERAEKMMRKKSMQQIREHALYQIVNGVNVAEVLQHTGGVLTRQDVDCFCRIMMLETEDDFFGKNGVDLEERILAKKESELQDSEAFLYLNLTPQQSIILLKNRALDCIAFANEVLDRIEAEYGNHCTASVSSEIQQAEQIAAAMEELEMLMENKFYHPGTRLFYSSMERDDSEIIQIDDDTLMKQMKQDIRMKDIQSLRGHFDRFSQKYRSKTAFSQMYIKFLFANLLKDIYDNLPGESEEKLNTQIDRLYRSFDFAQVTGIVRDAITRFEKAFSGKPQTGHREVEAVKQYIAAHYGEEMSVDRLSELVYMAPSYLSSVFKKETGQNLSRFIKSVRMEKAKELLEQTMMKIVDISTACGYPNVSYFCSSFREYYGISPQKFRESGDEMIEEK